MAVIKNLLNIVAVILGVIAIGVLFKDVYFLPFVFTCLFLFTAIINYLKKKVNFYTYLCIIYNLVIIILGVTQ